MRDTRAAAGDHGLPKHGEQWVWQWRPLWRWQTDLEMRTKVEHLEVENATEAAAGRQLVRSRQRHPRRDGPDADPPVVERAAADGRGRDEARDRAVPTKLPKANTMSLPCVAGAVAAGIGEVTETLEHYSELCLTPAVESARAFLEYLHVFTCAADSFLKRHLCLHVVQKGFLEQAPSGSVPKKKRALVHQPWQLFRLLLTRTLHMS